jgi:hypothetical protein
MTEQPEALRLADWAASYSTTMHNKCAAELRRLHEVNAELLKALRVAVVALAHATTETAPGLYDDAYNKVSAAIAKAADKP